MTMDELINQYILAPLLAVIGIILVGGIIETALGIQHATITLFVAIGGIWFFAKFYNPD